jgi:fumarate reductase subunit C
MEVKSKEYIRPIPATWWMHNQYLILFMIRELTALFVAGYAVFLMVMLYRFGQGSQPFHEFYAALTGFPSVLLQLVVLAFVVFHSVTWFNLTPKAIVLWRGEEKVKPAVIAGAHYGLWLVASVIIFLIVLAMTATPAKAS